MNTRAIRTGDLVEIDIRGIIFPATVRSKQPRIIGIDPVDPFHFTWRYCSARQVKRVIERPSVNHEKEAA